MTTPGKILQKSGKIVQRSGKIVQMNASGAAPCCCGDTCCSSGFLGYYPASGGNRVENQSMDVNVVQVYSGWTLRHDGVFEVQPDCTVSFDITSLSDGSQSAANCSSLDQNFKYGTTGGAGWVRDTAADKPYGHIYPSPSITAYPGTHIEATPGAAGAFIGSGVSPGIARAFGWFYNFYTSIAPPLPVPPDCVVIRLDGGFDRTKVIFAGNLILQGVGGTENMAWVSVARVYTQGQPNLSFWIDSAGRLFCYAQKAYGEGGGTCTGNAAVYVTFAGSGGLVLQDVTFMFNLTDTPVNYYDVFGQTYPTVTTYGAVTYTTDMRSC